MSNKKILGDLGERFVTDILREKGYEIIGRNFRTKYGEIDVIARKESCIHFIEVKTRTQDIYGRPCESVTKEKRERIKKVAQEYLLKCNMSWNDISLDVFELSVNFIENCM